MSASADIANYQMSAPFLVWGGAYLGRALIKFFSCEEGRSFEGDFHLSQGALSDNYGKLKINKWTALYQVFLKSWKLNHKNSWKLIHLKALQELVWLDTFFGWSSTSVELFNLEAMYNLFHFEPLILSITFIWWPALIKTLFKNYTHFTNFFQFDKFLLFMVFWIFFVAFSCCIPTQNYVKTLPK